MPNNPPAPVEEPTRKQQTVRAVKQFGNRHSEVVIYAAGVATGGFLFALASVLP